MVTSLSTTGGGGGAGGGGVPSSSSRSRPPAVPEEDDDCEDFETASVMPSPPLSSLARPGGASAPHTGANSTGTGTNVEGGASPPPPPGAAGSSDEGPYVYEAHQTSPNGMTDGRKGCRMC